MSKPCKNCGMYGHSVAFCWAHPKQSVQRRFTSTRVRRIGPITRKWFRTRAQWFKENQPDSNGFYTCYICGSKLRPNETTLDHVKPRSTHPELRFELSNLQPCCWRCNTEKGSKSLEESNGRSRG